MAVVPHTYIGIGPKYDTDGKTVVGQQELVKVAAQDANSYVNPAEVSNAVDQLKQALTTSLTEIQTKLRNVSVDANNNMLQVEDATMEPIINEAADSLNQIMPSLSSTLGEIVDFANTEHDKKQTEYNEAARAEAAAHAGVTSVQEV